MMEEQKQYFITDMISHETWGVKGQDKNHYVVGYISTDEVDLYNDVVTKEAMEGMVGQLKSGNIKLDVEHDSFRGKADIPIGKIVDAKMVTVNGKNKIWIKAMINKSHSKFGEVWKSIKDGFLDAFSIAYKATETMKDVVEGVGVQLLKGVTLLNVALTGNPVNKGATMIDSFSKSLQSLKEMEENIMTDENVTEPVVEETKVEAPVVEAEVVPATEEVKKEEPVDEETVDEPVVETPVEEVEAAKPLDEIKSLRAELKAVTEEFIAFKAEMKKPQLKSVVATETSLKVDEPVLKSPFDLI